MAVSSGPDVVDPIKASTLLSLEGGGSLRQPATTTPPNPRNREIRIDGLNNRLAAVWTGGRVVGVGSSGLNEDDVGQEKTLLSLHIVAATLLGDHARRQYTNRQFSINASVPLPPLPPTVYTVVPHTYQTIPLLHALLAEKLSDSATAVELLKDVRLLQYFDFAGLAEALSEVSEEIFQRVNSGSKETSNGKVRDVVLVQGLGHAISAIQRRSGLVQANALLAGLVRNITQLSRMSPNVLVLVDVSVETGWPASGEARQDAAKSKRHIAGIELDSAFASSFGECLRMICGHETLSKTLDVAFDTMVVVHDGLGRADGAVRARKKAGRRIVEITKDRMGDLSGFWGMWSLNDP
ncbi:hypothetical protein A1O1_09106 [Capronia coronata CBS 617.96]|uniref:Uncharacterized protein n=1 Tax=Capronia coronata CBS 617.96 TaxID=1182541 RepID=W9Y8H2_9EURO|nr:uncharacterized protein A1O1_09106 [Capronia coronata CBS 617.96]EXJ78704.1 hypothetical protein A1O1_09106 [Capronia coronata CBS 617.96]